MATQPVDYRDIAREIYASEDVEIDEDAALSPVTEGDKVTGVWVAAWVYVSRDDIEEG